MPFTVSHVVAVLPFVRGRDGGGLVPAGLVIGSMVPDLPYFIPPHRGSDWSHAAYGPVTLDLIAGLVLFALWRLVMRAPLVDLSPRWLRQRLPPTPALDRSTWLWAAISVVLGAATHVVWDTFTHRDRWGTTQVPWLMQVHAGLPGFKWLQYGSGVVGMAILALWLVGWIWRSDVTGEERLGRVAPGQRVAAWLVVAGCLLATVVVVWISGALRSGRWLDEVTAVRIATRSISWTATVVIVLCLAWRALPRRRAA
ncbi:MAG: DUF4184 family protein [Propionibacteriaceae bacterium]